MPYKIEYIQEDPGIIIHWHGIAEGREVIQSYIDRYSPLERFKTLEYVIIDYCDVTEFRLTKEVIQTVAGMSNDVAEHNRGLYAVAIMPADVGFGLGRMFQSYADDDRTGWHTLITRSRKEAGEWLRKHIDARLTLGDGLY